VFAGAEDEGFAVMGHHLGVLLRDIRRWRSGSVADWVGQALFLLAPLA
jgi:hypothetical protein